MKGKNIQPIDVIEDWDLPHHLACVVKYIARFRNKGDARSDLVKANWYLVRYVRLIDSKMAKALKDV